MTELKSSGVGHISRREAIALSVGAGLGIVSMRGNMARAQSGAPPVVPAIPNRSFPQPPSWKTEFKKLGRNVFVYVPAGGPGMEGGGGGLSNAGVIVGDDHLMVIDTMVGPILVQSLKAAVRQTIGSKPFGRVVNTHQHGDHIGGNQFFLPAEIVGHPFCRESVLQMAAALPPGAKFDKHEGWADGTEDKKIIAPSTTVTEKMTYLYGDSPVELIHPGVAHTWGDLIVYLPESKVVILGDAGFFYIAPFAHNGQVTQWLDVVDKILDMDVETIVPGHGPVGGKKELAEMGDYFRLLKREARKRFDAGMTAGKAAAEIKMGKFENWIGAERILLNTFRLYGEFNGTLTPTLDVEGMRRATDEYNAIVKART